MASSKSRFRSCPSRSPRRRCCSWKKKAGEAVARDEILIEIETDKVVLEVPAPAAGVLAEDHQGRRRHRASPSEVIAQIDTEGEGRAGAAAAKRAPPPSRRRRQPPRRQRRRAGRPAAMPAAAKLMAEQDLDTGDRCQGTGKRRPRHQGRRAAGRRSRSAAGPPQRRRPAAAAAARAAAGVKPPRRHGRCLGDRPEQRVPMSRLRARVAERLLQSQSTNAILTTFNEVNMAPVMEMRKRYQERFEKEHGVQARLHVLLRQGGGRTR